jgi:DsbC/DsbD-like thiol-disulfide interchange protein
MITTILRRLVCCIAAVGAVFLCAPAHAVDASSWHTDTHSALRLIAGGPRAGAPLRAGVELKLSPGWKTYWRYPGDSGVPPRFDFAQSANVKSINVQWPAPHRFVDESGSSIGYKDDVIFPIQVSPSDPSKPIILRLKLDYAVCEKLCVPAEGTAELLLANEASSQAQSLAAAEARVPIPTKLGDGAALAVRAIHRESVGGRDRVVVDVAAPASETVELFAEGPTPAWALPLPESIGTAPSGVRRYGFDLDGLPPGARATGAVLTLTLVAGGRAIEVPARLD